MPLQNANRSLLSVGCHTRVPLGYFHSTSGEAPASDEAHDQVEWSKKEPDEPEKRISELRSLLRKYDKARKADRSWTANFRRGDVHNIATAARKLGQPSVLDDLASDVLEFVPNPRRYYLAEFLLTIHHCTMFQPSSVADLFRTLPYAYHSKISLDLATCIATAVLRADPPDQSALSSRLVTIICRGLDGSRQRRLSKLSIISLFSYVLDLTNAGQEQHALKMFQMLVDTQYIPPEAIRKADASSRDFRFIITSAVARSCLYWNFRSNAYSFVMPLMQNEAAPFDSPTVDLVTDVLHALLEFPTPEDLNHSSDLVRGLAYHPVGAFVSHALIQQFYDAALRQARPGIAARFYHLTRAPQVLSKHEYSPSSRRRLALAAQLHDFISLSAQHGFATHARILYERYSVGKHKRLVVGNPAMVIRLSSLYGSLIRRSTSESSTSDPDREQENVSDGERSSRRVQYEDGEDTPEEQDEGSSDERHLDDIIAFSNRVLQRYRETLEPIREASHEALNALARSYFLLGDVVTGFEAFQVILDRQEIPDMHDVSVALSVMAEHSCRAAVRMMRRMIVRNLVPDSVAFGAVIHFASVNKDVEVMVQLFELARLLGRQLTPKTMTSLIRASVVLSRQDHAALRENLRRSIAIIEANLDAPHLPTPNMGKFCANEALDAYDPVLAFRFWRLLVKSKTEWDDPEQRIQRASIARGIRHFWKKGYLVEDEAEAMLIELEE
ncbi:hypothetical protein EW146_g2011 [Bondarzewia mesenterica]|uniref:Pentacotripeptide-repeat region of PRORP domain-containing protein n=1 Tax=Bondarzewia mesenterica TaxID=1095465 RepID=A0A4S4M242_9AGAM|nr:hypothetical protein EW146_g2011 [Bondarzewia mesenterica]